MPKTVCAARWIPDKIREWVPGHRASNWERPTAVSGGTCFTVFKLFHEKSSVKVYHLNWQKCHNMFFKPLATNYHWKLLLCDQNFSVDDPLVKLRAYRGSVDPLNGCARRSCRAAAILSAPPPPTFFNSARRGGGGGALFVTFLPLKWLDRILAIFHNYMPAFLVWIYRLTLTPVFRPTYLTHEHFC